MTEPRKFAEGTEVPVERTKSEIEKLLRAHGATGFVMGWDGQQGLNIFQCRIHERMIKFEIRDPDPEKYKKDARGFLRSKDTITRFVEAERRRQWRGRLLITKAKLEMIAAGDSTFEREFLYDIMLPDGSTAGQWMVPQINHAYTTGQAPRLLLGAVEERPQIRRKPST